MLVDDGKYFLYRHIRLDNNQVFYIGIGTKHIKKLGFKSTYVRAFSKYNRNKIWKAITSKTKYVVEIVLESDNYDFILKKEEEFIKLYGRIFNKTGTLSNIDSCGFNTVDTSNFHKKPIYCYNNKQWFESTRDCAKFFNLNEGSIGSLISSNYKQILGYYFSREEHTIPIYKDVIERLDGEYFKYIKNNDCGIMISNKGRVMRVEDIKNNFGETISYKESIILSSKTAYKNTISLDICGVKITTSISNIVYTTFIKDVPLNMIVDHKNRDVNDFSIENLFLTYRGARYGDCGIYRKQNGKYFARFKSTNLGVFNSKCDAIDFRNKYIDKLNNEL